MTKLHDLQILPIKDEKVFERLCRELWARILNDPETHLYGRRGQGQQGVDIIGRRDQSANWVGVQCKVRTGGVLTEEDVRNDAEAALDFNPKLSELVFATTAPRDTKIQTVAQLLTTEHAKQGTFSVTVWSWDDIQLELSEERNLDICRRYYKDFFIDYENLGIAISRVLRITIGVQKEDSTYEIILGKTPAPTIPKASEGLEYWKGNYFVVNLRDGKMETFSPPVHASDLEHSFLLKRVHLSSQSG